MRINYAIVFVSDMQRSVAFYRDTLGLPLRFQSPDWTEFATDGATLALHEAKRAAAAGTEPAAGSCRPGLGVTNLDEFHARVTRLGVRCVQAPKETFGTRIARYADPDGLVISVSEPGTQ
jgi:lactoylglutathione lyase